MKEGIFHKNLEVCVVHYINLVTISKKTYEKNGIETKVYNDGISWLNGRLIEQGLNYKTLTKDAKYTISFTQSGKGFVLRLHYNESKSFLFVNATKVYQFKAKDSEMKDCALCLGNVSKNFSV